MTGAAKIFPPGEAPAAEARAEAALERELAPDSAPLDISLDEAPAEPGRLARGAAAIREFWRHAPLGPGVYRMIGAEGEVLYVGKARSIKKRIAAYMAPERQPSRIARMVAQTRSMVFVTTESDAEALLLEANLIKQLKPRYNVTLRDDKSFPYILICTGHPAARLIKHRGARSLAGDYFGPFASAGAVFRTLNALQRAFLLRTCSDSFFANRTRPCLLYQIKRCSAPCTGEIALGDYAKLVSEARDFLSGRSRAIKSRLAAEMSEAAAALDFEKAARLRDRISALSAIQGEQSVNPRSIPEADVFAVTEEAGQFCVEVFFFRTYQNWGNRAYFPRADRALAPRGSARRLSGPILPRPAGAAAGALEPRGAERRDVVRGVERAGRPSDRHRRAAAGRKEGSRRRRIAQRARGAVAQARRSREPGEAHRSARPRRSASIIRSGGSKFTTIPTSWGRTRSGRWWSPAPKASSRTSTAPSTSRAPTSRPGDDYAMMREVLTRRFARLVRQGETAEAGAFPDTPDLVIIDGGRGQFEAAREVLGALGVKGVRLVAIAKGPDRNAGRETLLRRGAGIVSAAAARSGAVLHPAPARRSPPLRHRNPPRPAQEGVRARARSTKSPASARRASARYCSPSARPRPSPAPASPIWRRRRASTPRRRSWCTTFSATRAGGEEAT